MDKTKPIYTSVTLIGATLTVIGMLAAHYGLDINDQLQALVEPLAKVFEIVGVILTYYGRLRANSGAPITQAQLKVARSVR